MALLTAIGCSHDDSKSQSVPMDYGLMASVPRRCPPDTCKKCDFEGIAHQLAGPGATDCGWSHKNAERQKVVECALQKAAAGGQFFAIESLQGIDSYIVVAFVSGDGGRVEKLWYDSDGSGAACPCSAFVTSEPCESDLKTSAEQPNVLECEVGAAAMLCNEKT